jgi:hypothetical protein
MKLVCGHFGQAKVRFVGLPASTKEKRLKPERVGKK